jgi:hypothetical protein
MGTDFVRARCFRFGIALYPRTVAKKHANKFIADYCGWSIMISFMRIQVVENETKEVLPVGTRGQQIHRGALGVDLMRRFFLLLFLGVSLVVGSSCESLMKLDLKGAYQDAASALTPRDENKELTAIRKKYYSTWPKSIRRAVNNREVLIGMDKYQVQLALQIDEVIIQRQRSQTSAGPVEVWSVWKTPNGWAFVKVEPSRAFVIRFLNGVVVERKPQ